MTARELAIKIYASTVGANRRKWVEGALPPVTGSVWVETKDRMPTADDAPNRMGHVIWMVCDGFVCEPSQEPWNWKCPKCCDAVAWMPIPPHPKWYPLNAGGMARELAAQKPESPTNLNG